MKRWTGVLTCGAVLVLAGCTPARFPNLVVSPTPALAATAVVGGAATATVAASSTEAEVGTATTAPTTAPTLTTVSSTVAATGLPPATALPAATPVAAATAAPPTPRAAAATVPPPGIPVATVFTPALHDYTRLLMGQGPVNRLGRALAFSQDTEVSRQHFGVYAPNLGACQSADSLMLWRKDTRQIYFLVIGNTGLHFDACPDTWEVYPDTWQPGDPNNEDLTAPAGKVVPRNGFGKLWRVNFRLKDASLGYPSQPESYTTVTVQRFEHGTAFYFHDTGQIYVLFDEFRYQTRGGIVTGRVWFQAG
ncbi:MAG TPA: hypothetical protein VGA61_07650 [Anaerolineae bacterium]